MHESEFTKRNGERFCGGVCEERRCLHLGGCGNCGDGVVSEMEQPGSRKSRSQAGAELGRQDSSFAAPAEETAGRLAAGVQLNQIE